MVTDTGKGQLDNQITDDPMIPRKKNKRTLYNNKKKKYKDYQSKSKNYQKNLENNKKS